MTLETMGPVLTFMIRSQTVKPASSAILMKSQWAHFDLWLLTISVIFAKSRPSGFRRALPALRMADRDS